MGKEKKFFIYSSIAKLIINVSPNARFTSKAVEKKRISKTKPPSLWEYKRQFAHAMTLLVSTSLLSSFSI